MRLTRILKAIAGCLAGCVVGVGLSAIAAGIDSGAWTLFVLGSVVLPVALLDDLPRDGDLPRRPPPRWPRGSRPVPADDPGPRPRFVPKKWIPPRVWV